MTVHHPASHAARAFVDALPRVRVGDDACPFTAGCWTLLHRHRDRVEHNARMSRAVPGLDRLRDLDDLPEQSETEKPGSPDPH